MIWRAVITLLLLILSPLSIEHPRDGADDVSDEVVMERLIRHDRPIDGAFWHALADAGHAPLRQVGPDAVLVHTTVPVGLDVDPAEWRPHRPGGTPLAGDALRVVLEPRWPDLQGVRSALARSMSRIPLSRLHFNGILFPLSWKRRGPADRST